MFWKKKASVPLSREHVQLLSKLLHKEREALSQEVHDMADRAALKGVTLTVDSFCKVGENMSKTEKEEVARIRQSLLEKYGPTIPVNTCHRILWDWEGNGKMWNDSPGCFERHLQRREGNPLFPAERRIVTRKELEEAREKDRVEQQQFREKVSKFISGLKTEERFVSPNKASSDLQELQELLEEAASVEGDIGQLVEALERMEEKLTKSLNEAVPDMVDLLRRIHAQSAVARTPYLAQATRKDSPILKEEQIPALLSEDLVTIAGQGIVSRGFGPGYRPNESDIRSHIEKAVSQGFSKERAAQIIAAWNERKRKPDEAKE